jgi:hypothetical protein
MRIALSVIASLALAAYHSGGVGSAERFPPLTSMKAFTSAGQLKGAYRVAGIDGNEFTSLKDQFAVSISDDKIDVLENCVSNGWTYRFEGTQLVTRATDGPTCRRAMTDEEAALSRALTGASKASPTPWDGIMIEGAGGTVTLVAD